MADLAQKCLTIKQERKLHSDSPGASQHTVGNFFFSSVLCSSERDQALCWTAFTFLFFAVLTSLRFSSILGSSFSPSFSEQYARNCLLSACLCQVHICLRRIEAACRSPRHGSCQFKNLSSALIAVFTDIIYYYFTIYLYSCSILLIQAKYAVS